MHVKTNGHKKKCSANCSTFGEMPPDMHTFISLISMCEHVLKVQLHIALPEPERAFLEKKTQQVKENKTVVLIILPVIC